MSEPTDMECVNGIYSAEASDNWPNWKRRAFNVMCLGIWVGIVVLITGAAWLIWRLWP